MNKLLLTGQKMSNVFFNWSQNGERFTPEEIKMMKDLQREWDAERQYAKPKRRKRETSPAPTRATKGCDDM